MPALINLANIHYSRDEIAEAQALYERAIALEPDVFEAHFNLGNIFHDLGRYREAQGCYREALKLNPAYADAHFYLAVTLEKNGQSQEARTHWRAYQQLAPNGEWLELAREFLGLMHVIVREDSASSALDAAWQCWHSGHHASASNPGVPRTALTSRCVQNSWLPFLGGLHPAARPEADKRRRFGPVGRDGTIAGPGGCGLDGRRGAIIAGPARAACRY